MNARFFETGTRLDVTISQLEKMHRLAKEVIANSQLPQLEKIRFTDLFQRLYNEQTVLIECGSTIDVSSWFNILQHHPLIATIMIAQKFTC